MVKLNRIQSKAVKVIAPLDGQENFFSVLDSTNANKHGLTEWQIDTCIKELEKMNLLEVESTNEDKTDCTIRMSSELLAYSAEQRYSMVRTVFKYLFQLVIGASGGLAVMLLSTLF